MLTAGGDKLGITRSNQIFQVQRYKSVQNVVTARGMREVVQKRLSFERPFTTPLSPSEQQIGEGFSALQPRTRGEGGERKAGGRGGTVLSHVVAFGI